MYQRNLATPPWSEVSANYNHGTQAAVERLLALRDCPDERMILWHGPPGTGKTYALRALARAWRDWCDVSFITDPARFVGGSPTYVFEVANHDLGRSPEERRSRSKLIVREDAGRDACDHPLIGRIEHVKALAAG